MTDEDFRPFNHQVFTALRNIITMQDSILQTNIAALDAIKTVLSADDNYAERLQKQIAVEENKAEREIELLQRGFAMQLAELQALRTGLSKTVQ